MELLVDSCQVIPSQLRELSLDLIRCKNYSHSNPYTLSDLFCLSSDSLTEWILWSKSLASGRLWGGGEGLAHRENLVGQINPSRRFALISHHVQAGHCNSILLGLPANQLNRLQKLQNAAARIVSRTKSRCG